MTDRHCVGIPKHPTNSTQEKGQKSATVSTDTYARVRPQHLESSLARHLLASAFDSRLPSASGCVSASIVRPAFSATRFHACSSSTSRQRFMFSCLSLSLEELSSAIACSVSNFSRVHFSIACCSSSLSLVIYRTAFCSMEPLFFSQPGTILASSLMPSFIVSRRRRSTAPCQSKFIAVMIMLVQR